MSSYMPKAGDITRKWYVIDAEGKPLGKVAVEGERVHRRVQPCDAQDVRRIFRGRREGLCRAARLCRFGVHGDGLGKLHPRQAA